jgi:hypothetical protein
MHHTDPNNLASLVADLAEHLSLISGETWVATAHQHRANLRTLRAVRDSAEITIEPARTPGRLALSGSFWIGGEQLYDHRSDRTRKHTITTAADRPVIEIAREIARRLLPAYRADLAEARRRKAAYDTARDETAATAAELATIIGGAVSSYTDERDTFHNGSGRVSVKGRVSHGYGISLELRYLSTQAARRILEILKDERPVKP